MQRRFQEPGQSIHAAALATYTRAHLILLLAIRSNGPSPFPPSLLLSRLPFQTNPHLLRPSASLPPFRRPTASLDFPSMRRFQGRYGFLESRSISSPNALCRILALVPRGNARLCLLYAGTRSSWRYPTPTGRN